MRSTGKQDFPSKQSKEPEIQSPLAEHSEKNQMTHGAKKEAKKIKAPKRTKTSKKEMIRNPLKNRKPKRSLAKSPDKVKEVEKPKQVRESKEAQMNRVLAYFAELDKGNYKAAAELRKELYRDK
jgi:hypothetical protein